MPCPHWQIMRYPDSKTHGANMGANMGAQLGPTGPRCVPCWSHEPCYLGIFLWAFWSKMAVLWMWYLFWICIWRKSAISWQKPHCMKIDWWILDHSWSPLSTTQPPQGRRGLWHFFKMSHPSWWIGLDQNSKLKNFQHWHIETSTITDFNLRRLRLKHNGWHFTDNILEHIFSNANLDILSKISLKPVLMGLLNMSTLGHIFGWDQIYRILPEPMMTQLIHWLLYVIRPQWDKNLYEIIVYSLKYHLRVYIYIYLFELMLAYCLLLLKFWLECKCFYPRKFIWKRLQNSRHFVPASIC